MANIADVGAPGQAPAGFLKIKSRDFSGFGKAQNTMFSKTFIGFKTTLESFRDSQNLSMSI